MPTGGAAFSLAAQGRNRLVDPVKLFRRPRNCRDVILAFLWPGGLRARGNTGVLAVTARCTSSVRCCPAGLRGLSLCPGDCSGIEHHLQCLCFGGPGKGVVRFFDVAEIKRVANELVHGELLLCDELE